jgi:hypothetical protein
MARIEGQRIKPDQNSAFYAPFIGATSSFMGALGFSCITNSIVFKPNDNSFREITIAQGGSYPAVLQATRLDIVGSPPNYTEVLSIPTMSTSGDIVVKTQDALSNGAGDVIEGTGKIEIKTGQVPDLDANLTTAISGSIEITTGDVGSGSSGSPGKAGPIIIAVGKSGQTNDTPAEGQPLILKAGDVANGYEAIAGHVYLCGGQCDASFPNFDGVVALAHNGARAVGRVLINKPPSSDDFSTSLQIGGNVSQNFAFSGQVIENTIFNTSNTANAGVQINLITAGAAANDPAIKFSINAVQNWIIGIDNSDNDIFKISRATILGSNDALNITTSNLIGINTNSPEARLHVLNGSAGTVTANSNSILVIENNTNGYLSILTPTSSENGILFGSPTSSVRAGVIYLHNTDVLQFRTTGNITHANLNSTGLTVGRGTNPAAVALEINSASNTRFRIYENNSSSSYIEFLNTPTQAVINKFSATNALIDWNPTPSSSGTADFRLFRGTNTTGNCSISIFRGDNTANAAHVIGCKNLQNVVFNLQAEDIDFIIRSDNQNNMFVVDAGTDRIGIGIAAPTETFHQALGNFLLERNASGSDVTHVIGNLSTNASSNVISRIRLPATSNSGDTRLIFDLGSTDQYGFTARRSAANKRFSFGRGNTPQSNEIWYALNNSNTMFIPSRLDVSSGNLNVQQNYNTGLDGDGDICIGDDGTPGICFQYNGTKYICYFSNTV